jgi:hypothetical protein
MVKAQRFQSATSPIYGQCVRCILINLEGYMVAREHDMILTEKMLVDGKHFLSGLLRQ